MNDRTTLERACAHCSGPMTGKRPNAKFCGERCKDRDRRRRDREAGKSSYVKKGPARTQPKRLKYREGWTSANGQLTLARRIVGDSDRAWFECACGGVAKKLHIRSVATGLTLNCAERDWHRDPRAGRYRTGKPAYGTAHSHVKDARGPASSHACTCGAPAEHWAFQHGTPDALRDEGGKEAGRPYADDPRQYVALCRSCHIRWDRAHAQETDYGDDVSLVFLALWTAKQVARGEGVAHMLDDAEEGEAA